MRLRDPRRGEDRYLLTGQPCVRLTRNHSTLLLSDQTIGRIAAVLESAPPPPARPPPTTSWPQTSLPVSTPQQLRIGLQDLYLGLCLTLLTKMDIAL
ncbi:hypothetical protein [Streptomyces yanii]|uniref:Uncharacterized protein n=1 Tax=Streptomyces yanii TaxID=78510 RepID=A0ABV5RAD3_9ACTN